MEDRFLMFLRRLEELAALVSNRGKLHCRERSVLGSQLLANLGIVYRSWDIILSVKVILSIKKIT